MFDPKVVFGKHGTYAALTKAKAFGLTKFVGLSGHSRPQRFLHALREFDIDVSVLRQHEAACHATSFPESAVPQQ
jgi:hypothetical protein